VSERWLDRSAERVEQAAQVEGQAFEVLARPENTRRLKVALLVVACVWMVFSVSRLAWSLLPAPVPVVADLPVLNPQQPATAERRDVPVDIERLVGWHLFGEAGVEDAAAIAALESASTTQGDTRQGIEEGARETRLNLTLTGIVASTDEGLGFAIIEHQRRQAVYAVDDELPVGGRVKLAKVMADRVVLDNGGTYELLMLFEESELSPGISAQSAPAPDRGRPTPAVQPRAGVVDKRDDPLATTLASSYRERLYEDPQSLARVVQVSAVRENDQLLGYRVQPGQDQAQFERLGFEAGDVVTSVNGVSLDDPAQAMQLYQIMRTATEAVFTVQRKGQQVTLSVALDERS
jgi:general secretion pathway protein C